MNVSRARITALTTIAAIALLASAPVQAQQSIRSLLSGGERFEPDFLRRDVTTVVNQLQMDEGQRAIFETIFMDYEAAIAAAADEIRARYAERSMIEPMSAQERMIREQKILGQVRALTDQARQLADDGNRDQERAIIEAKMQALREEIRRLNPSTADIQNASQVIGDLLDLQREWLGRRRGLRDRFVSDTRAILNDQQLDQWPSVERLLRRQKSLPRAELSGEQVDLFLIVRDLDLMSVDEARVLPLLGEYEIALDAALVTRDDFLLQAQLDRVLAISEQDQQEAGRIADRIMSLRLAVRETNRRFAAGLQEALDPPAAASLRAQFRRTGYPRIFLPTRAERALTAAVDLDGLPAEHLATIDGLLQSFREHLVAMNEAFLAATIDEEPKMLLARYQAAVPGRQQSPLRAIRDASDARTKFELTTFEQLRSILGDDTYDTVPFVILSDDLDSLRRTEQMIRSGDEPPVELAGRFDRDGDGRLNDDERAELIRFLERQRQITDQIRRQNSGGDG